MSKFYNKQVPTSFTGAVGIGNTSPSQALDMIGNINILGSLNSSHLLAFKNRILNGNFAVDQLNGGAGVGGVTGNFLTYGLQPGMYNAIDGYMIASPNVGALTQKSVQLSSSDAAVISGVAAKPPTDSLGVYFPFNGSVRDESGGVTATTIGTMAYRQGMIGTSSLYLQNEGNVNGGSAAVNYLTVPSFTFPDTYSVSFWAYPTANSASVWSIPFSTNSGMNSGVNNSVYVAFSPTGYIVGGFYMGNNTSTTAFRFNINTWYHLAIVYSNGTLTLYINGSSIGSCTGSMYQSGFMLGNNGRIAPLNAFAGALDDFRIYNRVLSASEIAALAATTDFSNTVTTPVWTATAIGLVPNDNLGVYFPFDSTVVDVSGNGVTATTVGNIAYGPAVIGTSSLYLANEGNVNASTLAANYVACPSYQFTNTYTVSCWINPTQFGTNQSVFFITNSSITGQSSLNGSIALYINNIIFGNRSIRLSIYGTLDVGTSFSAVANTWYHVAYTLSGTALTLYVNGVSVVSTTGTVVHTGFKLGDSGNTSFYQPFSGFIDDFRIFNRVLSATEIAALATNVGTGVSPATTSFATQLTFDNTTADALGGLPAPTITGTAVFTPVCKTGTAALDLTANTAGGLNTSTATNAVTYTLASGSYTLPITTAGWFNVNSVSTNQVLWCIGNNSASNVFPIQIYTQSQTLVFNVGIGSSNYYLTTSFTISPGIWYHVALTAFSSGYFNAYVNGVLIGTTAIISGSFNMSGGSGSPNQLRIGAQCGTNIGYAFKGFIDDVRVYNRVLSSQEIAGLYASSQYASYSLLEQIIDGNNLVDCGWGTPAAQPVTTSMWIKNNSPNSQQVSVSLSNAGASLLAWLPFEGGSYADSMGFLNTLTTTGSVTLTSSVFKVGSACVDLTGNTIGNNPVATVNYNVPYHIQTPLTISCWLNAPSVTGSRTQIPLCLSSGLYYSANLDYFNTEIAINTSGQIYIDISLNGTYYSILASSLTTITSNTWNHVCYSISGNIATLFINGNFAGNVSLPTGSIFSNRTNSYAQISQLRLGGMISSTSYCYKGYIDDVRIYNTALSPPQIQQLYANNANSTASSIYLTPRSMVYTTPPIPANAWRRVSFTVPGDTAGNWLTTTDPGMTLAVCLGSSPLYNTTNVASSSGNGALVWNSGTFVSGNSVQIYGSAGASLLSSVANSLYITGVQLEKGTASTNIDVRPFGLEAELTGTGRFKATTNTFGPMITTSSGFVGIGTTGPQASLCVNGNTPGNGAIQVVSIAGSWNGDGMAFQAAVDTNNIMNFYNVAGTVRGTISGTASTVAYNTSSDERLKTNIVNMRSAIPIIKEMRPREFDWKADGTHAYGFVAQELFKVCPEMRNMNSKEDYPVNADGNPMYYGLDYGQLTPYLTKALQETINDLESTKQEIAEFKQELINRAIKKNEKP